MGEHKDCDGYCSCERVGHGDLGPVSDVERLTRIVPSSKHISMKNGDVKPSALAVTHLRLKGLSLTRIDKVDRAELAVIAADVAKTLPGNSVSGYLIAVAWHLRDLVDEPGCRLICVKDDPVEGVPNLRDNPAHALTVLIRPGSVDVWPGSNEEPEVRALRGRLLDLFRPLRQLADVYGA